VAIKADLFPVIRSHSSRPDISTTVHVRTFFSDACTLILENLDYRTDSGSPAAVIRARIVRFLRVRVLIYKHNKKLAVRGITYAAIKISWPCKGYDDLRSVIQNLLLYLLHYSGQMFIQIFYDSIYTLNAVNLIYY